MALHGFTTETTERKKYNKQKMNKTPTVKLTGVFPKTFRATKCETGRADCCFEYTDEKKKVFFRRSFIWSISGEESEKMVKNDF